MSDHPDGLAAAKRCATPGLCLFCEEPLVQARGQGRKRIICDKPECRQTYFRTWRRDRDGRIGLAHRLMHCQICGSTRTEIMETHKGRSTCSDVCNRERINQARRRYEQRQLERRQQS